MTAKSYSIEYRRQGIAGLTEIVATVYNVSTTDTISFGNDLNAIYAAIILQRTNATPSVVSVLASGAFTSNNICLPSVASLAGDNVRLYVVGPANASVA